jgi:transmembrane sensor
MSGASLPHDDVPAYVVDAAIAWSVRVDYNKPTSEAMQAFQQWLQADPRHQLAWQRIGSMRSDFAAVPAKLALDTLQAANAQRRRRSVMKLIAVAGTALATGWLAHEHTPWQRIAADASTGAGEQRNVQLADGTSVMLNTDSAIRVDLSGERRVIALLRGEVLVSTGADRRPFWVHTPFGTMQALGTRFVVRLGKERARVSVQEGAVALHPLSDGADGSSAIVRAGDSWWLSETAAVSAEPSPFDPYAWSDGVIAGKDMRLADFLAELSRYRTGRIVCDEKVADLRLSGVYQVRDTDRALQFLAQTQPLRVTYRSRLLVMVGPGDAR